MGGGGVAGLAALGTLLQLGEEDLLLLEATDRLGGRLTTVRHGNGEMRDCMTLVN